MIKEKKMHTTVKVSLPPKLTLRVSVTPAKAQEWTAMVVLVQPDKAILNFTGKRKGPKRSSSP